MNNEGTETCMLHVLLFDKNIKQTNNEANLFSKVLNNNIRIFINNKFFVRMEEFFALSKEEAPDNIPMMFITVPSAKDPEAKLRHPGTDPWFYCRMND